LQQKRDELAESVLEDQEPDFEDIDDEPIDHSGFILINYSLIYSLALVISFLVILSKA
jgi:hypothetical protein